MPFNHAGLFSARLEMRNFQSTLPQQPAHSSLFWLVMFLSEIDEKITLSLINAGILKILCTINCVPIVSVVVVWYKIWPGTPQLSLLFPRQFFHWHNQSQNIWTFWSQIKRLDIILVTYLTSSIKQSGSIFLSTRS